MADSIVEVKFGADASEFNANVALMKAQLSSLNAEIRNYARTMNEAGVSGSKAYLDVLVGMQREADSVSSELRGLNAVATAAAPAVERVATATEKAAGSARHASGAFGVYTQEVRALIDEASSGRWRQFDGTLVRTAMLAQDSIVAFAAANPILAGVAAAGAVAAGVIAYLAFEMHAVAKAQDEIQRGAAFSGNFGVVDAKVLDATRTQLEALKGIIKGIGEEDVAKITVEFARMGNTSNQVIGAMTADMTQMWKAFGEKEDTASKALTQIFSDPLAPIDRIAKELNGLSEGERKFIQDAQRANNPMQAQAAIQQVIAQRSAQDHSARIAQIDAEIAAYKKQQEDLQAYGRDLTQADQDHIAQLQREKAETKAIDDNLAGWAGKIAAAVAPAQMLEQAFRNLVKETLPSAAELETVQRNIAKIHSEMQNAGSGAFGALQGNPKMGELQAMLDAQIAKEHQLQDVVAGGSALERVRLQNLQDENAARGNAVAAAKKELEAIQAANTQTRKEGANPTLSSLNEEAEAQKRLNQAVYDSFLQTENLKAIAAKKNSAELIAIRENELAKARQMFDADSNEVKQREDALAQAKEQAAAKGAAAGVRAAKDEQHATLESLNTQISDIEQSTRTQIELIQLRVKAHALGAKQGEKDTQDAYRTEMAATDAVYARELQLLNLTEFQKQEIRDKEELSNRKINDEMTVDAQKAADAMIATWKSAADQISGAFTSQFDKILQGQENWRTAMGAIAKQLALDFINNSIKQTTEWVANQAAQVAASQAAEAAKAGAAEAGAAVGLAAQGATMVRSILGSAAEAFAGVFGFLSPVMGPAAAGPAAGAYGTVAGMAGAVASADIGIWNVPGDMPALIHRNELVAPPDMAANIRSLAQGGGQGGGNVAIHPTVNINTSAIDGASTQQFFRNNQRAMMSEIDRAVRHGAALGLRRIST